MVLEASASLRLSSLWVQEPDLHRRPPRYERGELLLLHPAMKLVVLVGDAPTAPRLSSGCSANRELQDEKCFVRADGLAPSQARRPAHLQCAAFASLPHADKMVETGGLCSRDPLVANKTLFWTELRPHGASEGICTLNGLSGSQGLCYLSYRCSVWKWGLRRDSHPRPSPYEGVALRRCATEPKVRRLGNAPSSAG